jgi:hypothetical protein
MKPIIKILIPVVAGIIAVGCATTPKDDIAEKIGTPAFEQTCSKCHTLDRVFEANKSLNKEQMRQVVLKMSKK